MMAGDIQINIQTLHLHCPGRRRPSLECAFTLGDQTVFFHRSLRMLLTLPPKHRVRFRLPTSGFDDDGNVVELATIPTITVSDPKLLGLLQPDPNTPDDPASGYLRAFKTTGSAQAVILEDEGDEPITIVIDVTIPAGKVATLSDPIFGEVELDPDAEEEPEPEPGPEPEV